MEVILEVWRQVFKKQKQRQNHKVHFCDVIETVQLVYVNSPRQLKYCVKSNGEMCNLGEFKP